MKEKSVDQNNYIIFSNYVYDVSPLRYFHPCGYQIIEATKGKEIDRYVYGMYASEK
jgi:cytochrome b involved in lipid metabolism